MCILCTDKNRYATIITLPLREDEIDGLCERHLIMAEVTIETALMVVAGTVPMSARVKWNQDSDS